MMAALSAWPALDALAWTLVHFLWQGCAIGLLHAVLRVLMPARRSHLRYAAGLLAMGALVCVPVCTFIVLSGRTAAAPLLAAGVEGVAGPVVAASAVAHGASRFAEWTVALWLAGVMAVALRSWLQWRNLKRAAHRDAWSDSALQAMLDALVARFGHVGSVRVRVSGSIDTPTLIGWLRPMILVPAAVALRFPASQLELILAHELGHLCRHDHLVNLMQAVVETLFFYHPVVHWIARDVRAEREICCDLLVLDRVESEPRIYARVLADLEELRQPPARLALAANGGVLMERVRRIVGMAPAEDSGHPSRRVLLAAVVLLGVVVLGGWARMERIEPRFVDAPPAWHEPVALPTLSPPPDIPPVALAPMKPVMRFGAAPAVDAPAVRAGMVVERAQAAPVPQALAGVDPHASLLPVASQHVDAPMRPSTPSVATAPLVAEAPAAVSTAAPEAVAAAVRPRATRMVQPDYPEVAHSSVAERVDLAFDVSPDGSVGRIEVVSAPRNPAFARAARRALGKWRFDPASVVAGVHYRQAFVFAMPGQELDDSQGNCGRVTGSMLCRRGNADTAATGNATAAALRPVAGIDAVES